MPAAAFSTINTVAIVVGVIDFPAITVPVLPRCLQSPTSTWSTDGTTLASLALRGFVLVRVLLSNPEGVLPGITSALGRFDNPRYVARTSHGPAWKPATAWAGVSDGRAPRRAAGDVEHD